MGLLDRFTARRDEVAVTRSALEAAAEPGVNDNAITKLVQMVLNLGLDGTGPVDSAVTVAEHHRRRSATTEESVDKVIAAHQRGGALGGFLTGVGGFVTMPVALPANVLEFYVQATRMVGGIAHLRGYDVSDPKIRTAILLTLIGSNAEEVLSKAGVTVGSSGLTALAAKRLPPAGLLIVNKAIGFRLLRGVGEKLLSRVGRGLPFAGGIIGAGVDWFMMARIAEHARTQFPTPEEAPTREEAPAPEEAPTPEQAG